MLWAQKNAPPATGPAVVALTEVPAGQTLTEADVEVRQWPLAHRPPAAARSPDEIVGRVATSAISAGEPLTAARVAGPGALDQLGGDNVAVTITEDPLAKSGLVRAGDRVNVVGQSEAGPRTLVNSATVLAISDEDAVIVAVPATSAGAVVQAAATRSAAVVLLSAQP